jgi:hypothetical protein
MESPTRDDLKVLIETEGEWCVSFFMPTMRGAEAQQNVIRFRNLLREAEVQLSRVGMRVPDVEAFLSPAQGLLNDAALWRDTRDGLAVFVAENHLSHYHLPVAVEEGVTVRRRFHLLPLLALLSGNGRFYVLALSQDQVRLLEGTRDSVHEIDLVGVPESLAAALQYDRSERQVRAAAVAAPAGGGGSVHGTGTDEDTKLDILRYFQMVDRGLRDMLGEQRVPLVLAGVDYLLPIYREANTYSHLVDTGVTGNPQTLNARELHRRAWEIVKPYFAREQASQEALYRELAGRQEGRASNNLKQIMQAAHGGRVATLFLARGVRQWGVYRAHSGNVHVHPSQQPGDHDLLDLAAIQTVANGGTVYVVDRDQMPGGEPQAAIFRY